MKLANALRSFFLFCCTFFISHTQCDKYSYVSHQSLVKCSPSEPIQFPANMDQLSTLVQRALLTKKKLKPVGTLNSISDIICTEGWPVSLQNINHTIFNPDDGTASFGAGIMLSDALLFLEGFGRTLQHMPFWGSITVGGALATGAHGSSIRHPTSLSDQVVSLTFLNSKGVLTHVTDSRHLRAFRVNLGLLGIIVQVTFNTVPLFKITKEHSLHPDSLLFEGETLDFVKTQDIVIYLWFPFLGQVILINGTHHQDMEHPGNAETRLSNMLDSTSGQALKIINDWIYWSQSNIAFRFMHRMIKRFLSEDFFGIQPFMVDDGKFANPGTGIGWRMLVSNCFHNCLWFFEELQDTSLAMPLANFYPVLSLIKNLAKSHHEIFHSGAIYIRFIKSSDAFLSISEGRDSFTVEWITSSRIISRENEWAKKGVQAYHELVTELIEKWGARPHWGKRGMCYFQSKNIKQNLNQFEIIMKNVDPQGSFQNTFSKRLFNGCESLNQPFCSYEELNAEFCFNSSRCDSVTN